MQKLKRHKTSLRQSSAVSEKDKAKWMDCIFLEIISSEDSGDDSDEDGSFVVRPMPWRSDKASSFLLSLDRKHDKKQSRVKLCPFRGKRGYPRIVPSLLLGLFLPGLSNHELQHYIYILIDPN